MGPIAYENGVKTVYKMQAPLSLECFRINKRTAQLTRRCSKCLDNEKMYKENRKCKHGRPKEICCECKGSRICHRIKQRSTCHACGGKQILSTQFATISLLRLWWWFHLPTSKGQVKVLKLLRRTFW